MRQRINGVINGTGAALTVCLGFVPDYVTLRNTEDADEAILIWTKNHARSADQQEGMRYAGADVAGTPLTVGLGVVPYLGREVMTSSNQTDVTYGGGIYIERVRKDYRYYTAQGNTGDAVSADINSWTLGNATNFTGNFNSDVTGTYIGEGSEITIDGDRYFITALTAAQGSAANEVTLNRPAPTGVVEFIGPMYDYAPVALGDVSKAGFTINATDVINVNDESIAFEAGTYDD